MFSKHLLYILFVSLILISCEKDIIIEPSSSYTGQLFIESTLFPGKKPKVFLNRSLPFFSEKVTPQELFAKGAEVTISDNANTDVLKPDSIFDNFRCRWVPFYKGEIPSEFGKTYTLSVTFEGQTYTATTTIDQSKIKLDTIEYTAEFFDVYGGHDGVILNFTDAPGTGDYYRFQMNRRIDASRKHAHVLDPVYSSCTQGAKFWVTDLGRTIFSDENVDGHDLRLYIEVSFEYRKGDSAWVSVQSLDEKSAEFFQDLDKQLEAIQNPFVEPVFIESKIDGAMGVFGSAVYSDSVLFIYPQNNP